MSLLLNARLNAITSDGGGVIFVDTIQGGANVGLTADAGSGQGDGVITSSYNVYSVVATAGDAATLPATSVVGQLVYVKNDDSTESMDVFPASGDDAGAGTDTAVAIAAGASKTFMTTVADATWTELIVGGAGGGGGAQISGTPSNNQIGVWTSATDIEGDANFTWSGTLLIVGGDIRVTNVGGPQLKNDQATATNPTLIPDRGDLDTGIGYSGTDALSLVAGSIEAMRFSEFNNDIMVTHQALVSVSANAGGGQGSATILESSYNVITTVTTTGDSVKLNGTAFPVGTLTYVKNNGANACDVFPASGDNLGEGVDTAVSLPAGDGVTFIATTAGSVWTQLVPIPAAGGDVTASGSPLNNEVAVFTGGNDINSDSTFTWDGTILSATTFGSGNGAVGAPSVGIGTDGDTGFYRPVVDAISATLGGVQTWSFQATQFNYGPANGPALFNAGSVSATVPTLGPNASDANSGIGHGAQDSLSMIAGGVEGRRYTELSSGILASSQSDVGLTAHVGSAQGNGVITSSYNVYSTVANVGDAATLPTVFAEGTKIYIKNDGANSMDVFPASGDDAGEGTNIEVVVAPNESATFIATVANSTWTKLIDRQASVGGSVQGEWKFDSTTSEANPGSGLFRNDNATIGSVTEIFINSVNEDGGDFDLLLSTLSSGDSIYIQKIEDSSEFLLFDITANVDNTGWFSLAGTVNASGSNFTDGKEFGIVLLFGGTGGGGGGDVTKVGTPVNNQIGVWTGDGTIEGDANFTWSGSVFQVGGTIQVSNSSGGSIVNEAASATNPTLLPDKTDIDTGIGQAAADQLSLIAGGVEMLRLVETGTSTTDQVIIGPAGIIGSAATPALAFGDGDTGFYEPVDDFISVAMGGTRYWTFATTHFSSNISNGPQMRFETATATNPTLCPSQIPDTGIGANANDDVSIIGGGVELLRARNGGSLGQTQVILGPAGIIGTAATPALAFGDGNTGFYETTDNILNVSLGSAAKWTWDGNNFESEISTGPVLKNQAASSTQPTVFPDQSDPNTGIGANAADQLSLITGGQEGIRLSMASSEVIATYSSNVGLTAHVGSSQGDGVILSSYNVYSTVANVGDAATLPSTFSVGTQIYIKNDGANSMDVFPALGDNAGAGTNTAVAVAVGVGTMFMATTADATWTQMY